MKTQNVLRVRCAGKRLLLCCSLITSSVPALAQSYKCETFSLPGYSIAGINKSRVLVGNSGSGSFMRDAKGAITFFPPIPGSLYGPPTVGGINNAGDVSLSWDRHGSYILSAAGKYIFVPSPFDNISIGGINDQQDIGGLNSRSAFVQDVKGNVLYMQSTGGLPYPVPGPLSNDLSLIFGDQDIYYIGSYIATPNGAQGLGFAVPGPYLANSSYGIRSEVWGLNNLQTIAGYWVGESDYMTHSGPLFSFVHKLGTSSYPAVVCPGFERSGFQTNVTLPLAVNDDGVIAGVINAEQGQLGFIATPVGNPHLELSSDKWDFGSHTAVPYGTTQGYTATIYVRNAGDGPLHIPNLVAYPYENFTFGESNDPTSYDFTLPVTSCEKTIPAGGWCSLTFQWTPHSNNGAFGPRTIKYFLADDSPDAPHIVILKGTIIEKWLRISNTSWTFSSHPVGQKSGLGTVYLYTVGGAPVTFSPTSITGPDAADFSIVKNTCLNQVKGYITCSVSLVFTPSAAGRRTAVLSFADDADSGSPQVTLSGVGVAPKD